MPKKNNYISIIKVILDLYLTCGHVLFNNYNHHHYRSSSFQNRHHHH